MLQDSTNNNYIASFVKKIDFDDKFKNLNKKQVLVENELKRLQTFDSNFLIGQGYFNSDGAHLYLILQLLYHTLKRLSDA